ncbi:hypothetical protein ABZ612_28980 [Streptomyces avermitilis]|uniref:hypothetical protein n=1 Tax=Streptomyces avermitilis TaxID=33903 RepID=UPI0033E1C5CB
MPNIRVDARRLTGKKFLIPGQTATPIDATTVISLALAPGTYVFQQMSEPPATFTFDVTPDGFVTYDPANEGFLAGQGTGTLIVQGFAIAIDGRALSHDLITVLPGNTDVLSRDSTHELTLIPGTYRLALVSSVADFAFVLAIDGRVSIEPRYTGFAKAVEQTLTIHGYRIAIDGRALSHDLITVLPGNTDVLSRDSTHELTLIPGTYRLALVSSVADFAFVLAIDGRVSIEPRYTGFAKAVEQTLTIHGYRITIDGRALSHDLIPVLPGNTDVLSRDSTHELTLIPGTYRLALVSSVADFAFVLAIDGRVSIEPRYTGFAKAVEQTLTIHGYRITIDGRALSHDLIPVLPGNTDVLSRDSTHELTLIPDQVYKFLPRDAGISFTLTLDIDGTVSVVPGGLTVEHRPLRDRLLDDFTTGLDSFAVPLSATTSRRQTGAMLGGERSTSVTNLASAQGALGHFDVGSAGCRLQLTLGVDQQARLQVSYGLRDDGTLAPLGVNLHDGGVDRLRTTISRVNGSTDVKVTVFTPTGPSSARARASGGLIEFRFVDFAGPGGQDFTDVSHIVFEFVSGDSFTVDVIEACGPHRVSRLVS